MFTNHREQSLIALEKVTKKENQTVQWIIVKDVVGAIVHALLEIAAAIRSK